ncbi:MAG: Nif3-like dinuclear metal center hexameric protein [Verrucomicrobiota bacterium]|nr:Nif3-like dinuclear metal center hexameric protein [Verrucomicrobiota bacterium]
MKAVKRDELIAWINDYLEVEQFSDGCLNGLQVEGDPWIERVVCGTTASLRLIEAARARSAQLVIVHHGLFKGSLGDLPRVIGPWAKRLRLLLENGISLAGYHLPLDAHSEVGNNVLLCQRLGLTPGLPLDVGFMAEAPGGMELDAFVERVRAEINPAAQVFAAGSNRVRRVAVISGGASSLWPVVLDSGADTFLSGEPSEHVIREIEEAGLHAIFAGHYATEVFGVQALGQRITDTFGIPVEFVDIPNPV